MTLAAKLIAMTEVYTVAIDQPQHIPVGRIVAVEAPA